MSKIIHIGMTLGTDVPFKDRHKASWCTPFIKKSMEYSSEYEFELWKVYDTSHYGNRGVCTKEEDGIKFILFPVIQIKFSGRRIWVSFELLKELRKRINANEKNIFHMQSVDGLMQYLIAFMCKRVPLLAQQRGPNCPPLWRYKRRKEKYYLLLNLLRVLVIDNIDFVFASSKGAYFVISNELGRDRVMHMKGGGFDFENHAPLPKEEIRSKLGLPKEKKIMIHIGRLNQHKGVHNIVNIYELLKKEYDIQMIFIGGDKSEPLYDSVIKSGATFFPRMKNDDVLDYLNASDVCVTFVTEDLLIAPFSDIGTAQVESLAMNTPDVSSSMIHFLGTKDERNKLGYVAFTPSETKKKIKLIFDNPLNHVNTRKIMKKYYNWPRIIGSNFLVYREIIGKYYDN